MNRHSSAYLILGIDSQGQIQDADIWNNPSWEASVLPDSTLLYGTFWAAQERTFDEAKSRMIQSLAYHTKLFERFRGAIPKFDQADQDEFYEFVSKIKDHPMSKSNSKDYVGIPS